MTGWPSAPPARLQVGMGFMHPCRACNDRMVAVDNVDSGTVIDPPSDRRSAPRQQSAEPHYLGGVGALWL